MYYIYKERRLIGSSSSIEYVVEFTKLMIDKAIDTERDASRLKQLYEDKLVLNSPKVGVNQLQHILERLGYELTIEVDDSTI